MVTTTYFVQIYGTKQELASLKTATTWGRRYLLFCLGLLAQVIRVDLKFFSQWSPLAAQINAGDAVADLARNENWEGRAEASVRLAEFLRTARPPADSPPKTVQGILRHSRIQTILDLYTQDDSDETRAAQGEYLTALGVGTHLVQ